MIDRALGLLGRGAVDERALEVLGLEDLAELLDTPVLDEELEPGLRAQTAVAVVTEDRDDTLPDIGDFVERNPGADALASIGLVDSPPPTQRSRPGPCSGWFTPMKAMSLIS